MSNKHLSEEARIKRDIERTQYDTEGASVAPTWSVIEARDLTNGAHTTSITAFHRFQYIF